MSEARGLFSGRGYSSSMIVFVCAAGGEERTVSVSKSSALQGRHKAWTLSSTTSSSSFYFSVFHRRSFTNMVPLAPGLPMSITHTARLSESCLKPVSQSRHGTGAFIFLIVGNGSKAISIGKWRGFPRHLFCLQNTQGLNRKKESDGQSRGAARLSRG